MPLFGSRRKGIPMLWKELPKHQTKYIHQLSTPYSIWRTFLGFENGWRELKLSHKVKGPKRGPKSQKRFPTCTQIKKWSFCRKYPCICGFGANKHNFPQNKYTNEQLRREWGKLCFIRFIRLKQANTIFSIVLLYFLDNFCMNALPKSLPPLCPIPCYQKVG